MGCATTPKISPMQRRQITTKTFESSYENVYRATLTVLQDQGYIIKNTDMKSGLIRASVSREASFGRQVLEVMFFSTTKYVKDTLIELSCMVNELNDDTSEVRINIQEVVYQADGTKRFIKQIYDPKIFKTLFDQIRVEIKRREAINN